MPKTITQLLFLFFSILSLSGCLGPSTYQFNNTLLSDSRDEKTKKIIEPMTIFPSDIAQIYGQSTFAMPNDGEMTYILINFALVNENGDQEIVDSSTKSTQHGGLVIFSGKRPGFSWPVGQYVVDFVINDISYSQYQFEIISVEEISGGEKAGWASDYNTSKSVDSSHNPLQTTSNFSVIDKEIFLTFKSTATMPKNTAIKVDWKYLNKDETIISQTQSMSKNEGIHFSLDKTYSKDFLLANSDWPTGSYEAAIYFNNTLVKKVQFKIN